MSMADWYAIGAVVAAFFLLGRLMKRQARGRSAGTGVEPGRATAQGVRRRNRRQGRQEQPNMNTTTINVSYELTEQAYRQAVREASGGPVSIAVLAEPLNRDESDEEDD